MIVSKVVFRHVYILLQRCAKKGNEGAFLKFNFANLCAFSVKENNWRNVNLLYSIKENQLASFLIFKIINHEKNLCYPRK
jgi:hypothetical protein